MPAKIPHTSRPQNGKISTLSRAPKQHRQPENQFTPPLSFNHNNP
ncbi:hypothetical protein GCWU000324_01889 [Kingella oralis ATCC 51147]|uniref:Uncharacterized protein n=1 Tax=Kingella oralis ATCC 51147 TaxID=629741 RepID=C4GIL8_9NEIS|nr:hypothetical protein GCWU000324_01889 [Kingella oralis ATCC 51147]